MESLTRLLCCYNAFISDVGSCSAVVAALASEGTTSGCLFQYITALVSLIQELKK